jgi:hypothetical protein
LRSLCEHYLLNAEGFELEPLGGRSTRLCVDEEKVKGEERQIKKAPFVEEGKGKISAFR